MSDPTELAPRTILEMVMSGAAGAAVVGPLIGWLFREKLNAWADSRARKVAAHRLDLMEGRMAEIEKAVASMSHIATSIDRHIGNLARSLENVNDKLDEQGRLLASQGATIEMLKLRARHNIEH